MPLWGATDVDESKPKNLTTAEKKQVYAKAGGWVAEPALSGNGNPLATPEVLVAIRNLAVKIGLADITEIEFITTTVSAAIPADFSVRVRFNEAVTVAGTPTCTVDNDRAGGGGIATLACEYDAAASTPNEMVFTKAWTGVQFAAGDVLSIGIDAMALNSGSVIDVGGDPSTITNVEAIGTAAGTITVAA